MFTKEAYQDACKRALISLEKAQIAVTDEEKANMEVAEYGMDMLDEIGLELIVYVNTDRCCAKELILFPGQTCPEHRHPAIEGEDGKEETFRCRQGQVYLYVEGDPTPNPRAKAPESRKEFFTVWHEIILNPGEQYTLSPNTLHWFQAGPDGAIVSEFSTKSRDECDIYTDPCIDPALDRHF
ncbi:MAG: D-lyxose/D-mannose family sugar isomerase [Spartobacteria bacterium]|nr:D-lyxose/D-mannose family sugar isomerase [Spartobacteria bacterium]